MGTFAAVGVSASLIVPSGYSYRIALSGTWVALVLLQRQEGNGWKTVGTFAANTDRILQPHGPNARDAQVYRLQCLSYTSGTVTYTLALSGSPELIPPLIDAASVEQFGVNSSGARMVIAIVSSLLRLTGIEDGLTAHAGGTQAAGLALDATKSVHRVTTVGSANDSILLPPATVGEVHIVMNSAAANSMQVFGAGTDTINDVVTATGVAQAAGKMAIYICVSAGKWYRILGA